MRHARVANARAEQHRHISNVLLVADHRRRPFSVRSPCRAPLSTARVSSSPCCSAATSRVPLPAKCTSNRRRDLRRRLMSVAGLSQSSGERDTGTSGTVTAAVGQRPVRRGCARDARAGRLQQACWRAVQQLRSRRVGAAGQERRRVGPDDENGDPPDATTAATRRQTRKAPPARPQPRARVLLKHALRVARATSASARRPGLRADDQRPGLAAPLRRCSSSTERTIGGGLRSQASSHKLCARASRLKRPR
jgi:hypothetical protein